jgi:hypothetical protein
MYQGWTRLLIVYLTHPGVLVPIPGKGLWSWARGLWQASWVMVMHSFSEGSRSLIASLVYWFFFALSIFMPVAGEMNIDWSRLTQSRRV